MPTGQNAPPTIRDIADAAGVSIATVSRVLNGRPDVSPKTREAVLRVVREQGFSMNRNARALSGGRTGLIGVTLPMVHIEYFSSILWGASEALYEHDMRHRPLPDDARAGARGHAPRPAAPGDDGRCSADADQRVERCAQGARATGLSVRRPRSAPAGRRADAGRVGRTPGPARRQRPSICSRSDTAGSGRSRARTAGSRAWIGSPATRLSLAAAGLSADPELIAKGNFTNESGYAGASELLSLRKPPTAIFAFNDEMAVGAMRAAEERGLEIPRDLSIVGFDDVEKTQIVTPSLTTVRQPLAEMGRMAVSLLTRLLERSADRSDARRARDEAGRARVDGAAARLNVPLGGYLPSVETSRLRTLAVGLLTSPIQTSERAPHQEPSRRHSAKSLPGRRRGVPRVVLRYGIGGPRRTSAE